MKEHVVQIEAELRNTLTEILIKVYQFPSPPPKKKML